MYMGKDFEGSGYGLIQLLSRNSDVLMKFTKNLGQNICNTSEIRTEYLQCTTLEHYRYDNSVDKVSGGRNIIVVRIR